jgi:tetratricopeptide (TPR) repeat protein
MARAKNSGVRSSSAGFSFAGGALQQHWLLLHKGDREPYPTEKRIAQLAEQAPAIAKSVANVGGAKAAAAALQDAWRAFHEGDFQRAIEAGGKLGVLGAIVANKSAAIHAQYREKDGRRALRILQAAIERGETAAEDLPDSANAHYTLALVLGRHSQRSSIVEALAAGFAGRIRAQLERTLKLEPGHAEAHVAFGLYHAEIVAKLGGLAARLTYGATLDAATGHFKRAIKLAPESPVTWLEYAHGLHLLDARKFAEETSAMLDKAAGRTPRDAMEQLDVEHAKQLSGGD